MPAPSNDSQSQGRTRYSDSSAELDVRHLRKVYGEGERSVKAIDCLSFSVQKGEFACIVGPSGCGKTTLLRCLAGLLPATSGEVRVGGRLVEGPPEKVAFVFQDYNRSLFPWMTVAGNVGFPLRRKGIRKGERLRQAKEALGAVDLRGAEDRYPWQLSGGMQQRVAIARALAYQPEVMLMDEPFASVDAQTRADLEDMILRVRAEYAMTVLLVTHDIDESVYLGDRVIVLAPPPTRVLREFQVDVPEPRDQVNTKGDPTFTALRAEVWHSIRRSKEGAAPARTESDDAPPVDGNAALGVASDVTEDNLTNLRALQEQVGNNRADKVNGS